MPDLDPLSDPGIDATADTVAVPADATAGAIGCSTAKVREAF